MSSRTQPFGLRIPNNLLKKLKKIAETKNQTPNQTAITAIEEWIDTITFTQQWRSVIITKDFLSRILSFLPEENVVQLAEETSETIAEIIRDYIGSTLNEKTYKYFIEFFPALFGESGLLWFDSISIELRNNIQVLKGFHYLDINFSKFFTQMIQILLNKYFNIDIVPVKSFNRNSVFIEIKKK